MTPENRVHNGAETMLLRLSLSLLLLLSAPAIAAADTCTFSAGASSWNSVDIVSGAGVDCGGGVPGPDDSFVIPAGASVLVTGDLLWDGLTPERSVQVESGGSLSVQVTPATGPITLAANDFNGLDGIRCDSGSTCSFHGGYRQFGSPTPTLQSSLGAAGFFEAGEVVPCPGWNDGADRWEPDCEGNLVGGQDRPGSPDEVGLVYLHSLYAADVPALDALELDDLLCFSDPDPDTPEAPVDDGYCYAVTLAEGTWAPASVGQGVILIDVRQTDTQQPRNSGFPLALRQVQNLSPTSGVAVGTRYVETAPSFIDCPDTSRDGCRDTDPWSFPDLIPGDGVADRQHVGRFLRFEQAGSASPLGYRISRSFDDYADDTVPGVPNCSGGSGSCDVLEIYDPRGFQSALDPLDPNADECWIDYGHASGDAFFVLAPVTIRDADPDQSARRRGLRLEGDGHSLQSVLLTDTGALRWANASEVEATDLVFRDVHSGAGGMQWGLDLVDDASLERVSFTGGAEDMPRDDSHVITLSGTPIDLVLRGVSVRHHGDDFLSGPVPYTVDAERLRLQWISDEGNSMQVFGFGGFQQPTGSCIDCECVDCVSNDLGPEGGVVGGPLLEREGLLKWGTPGALWHEEPDAEWVVDYLSVGGEHVLPARVDGFVVALADHSGSAIGGISGALDPDVNIDVRNGIVRDFTRDKNVFAAAPSGALDNVIFLDVGPAPAGVTDCASTVCNALRVINNAPGFDELVATNVSIVVRPGSSSELDGAVAANSNTNDYSSDGLLVYGLSRSSQDGIAVNDTGAQARHFFQENTGDTSDGPELTMGPCIDDVKAAITPGHESQLPASALLGSPLDFVDPASDRYDPLTGGNADLNECGIRGDGDGPGVADFRWMHAVSRVVPESMGGSPAACNNGLDDDADSLVDYPEDPGCQTPYSTTETRQCQDGLDNDADGTIDFDGGTSIHGSPIASPDPQCNGLGWVNIEKKTGCGLGPGVALLGLGLLYRNARRARDGKRAIG